MEKHLTLALREDFDRVYQLMEEAFPDSEFRNYEGQKALLDNSSYRIWVWKENQKINGFLTVWELDNFCFIEHFAVDRSLRGNGMGAVLLKEYLSQSKKSVVLEVEHPETEIAARRIRFYERAGLTLNQYPYYQPPLRAGMELLPLFIMSYPQSLSQKEFAEIKDVLYRKVYHFEG